MLNGGGLSIFNYTNFSAPTLQDISYLQVILLQKENIQDEKNLQEI